MTVCLGVLTCLCSLVYSIEKDILLLHGIFKNFLHAILPHTMESVTLFVIDDLLSYYNQKAVIFAKLSMRSNVL